MVDKAKRYFLDGEGKRVEVLNVAFIGLGVMGSPMAVNLAKAGHSVVGFNRSPMRTTDLLQAGGHAALSIAEAVEKASIICTMLPDTSDVLEVLGASGGVLESASEGALVVDFSTISPGAAAEMAKQARQLNLRPLDAPVSGGERGAWEGSLAIMVGGSPADFEAAMPVFDVIGSHAAHMGPSGAGQRVKAANQLIVAAHIAVLSEAIVFLLSQDVDPLKALDLIGRGLGASRVIDQKAESMVHHDFKPGFRIGLHDKDLQILMSEAQTSGLTLPLSALISELMASSAANGDDSLDHSGLVLAIERLNKSVHA